MADASPDPVADAGAYQRLLISLLGTDDPAAVQEATPGTVREILEEAGAASRRRPAEAEWSVLELLGHLADAEIVSSGRYRWALAQDEPPLPGYEQDGWVDRLRHNDDDPAELLSLFETLRRSNIALWHRTSQALRARVGLHAERGPESYDLMFRLIAGHDRLHVAQMRTTIALATQSGANARQR